jgi:DNA-binding IclR family transcriptional regulator
MTSVSGEGTLPVDLLTKHAHVLHCVARQRRASLREIAACVGVTERTAHRLVCQLEAAGHLSRHREGSHNTYEVHSPGGAADARERQVDLADIVRFIVADARRGGA